MTDKMLKIRANYTAFWLPSENTILATFDLEDALSTQIAGEALAQYTRDGFPFAYMVYESKETSNNGT